MYELMRVNQQKWLFIF